MREIIIRQRDTVMRSKFFQFLFRGRGFSSCDKIVHIPIPDQIDDFFSLVLGAEHELERMMLLRQGAPKVFDIKQERNRALACSSLVKLLGCHRSRGVNPYTNTKHSHATAKTLATRLAARCGRQKNARWLKIRPSDEKTAR